MRKKANQFYKIIASLKDAKLPCIFALQTDKVDQMQEGEPVRIQGELAAYEDQLNLTFSLPESLTYLYAIRCTVYDEERNAVVTTYLNPTYGV